MEPSFFASTFVHGTFVVLGGPRLRKATRPPALPSTARTSRSHGAGSRRAVRLRDSCHPLLAKSRRGGHNWRATRGCNIGSLLPVARVPRGRHDRPLLVSTSAEGWGVTAERGVARRAAASLQ